MNVSAWCIRNPIPSVMLFVLLTLAGLMGFRSMKVQMFPDLELPVVTITATLPGASPSQLETEVVRKIENSVAAISGVKHIHAKVHDSSAVISGHAWVRGGTVTRGPPVRPASQGFRFQASRASETIVKQNYPAHLHQLQHAVRIVRPAV